jgi:hypothetical protein
MLGFRKQFPTVGVSSNIPPSRTAVTVTAVGNGQVDTAQSKFGGASYLGDGTGDYLNITPLTPFNTGTGSFTYECWFRLSNIATMSCLFDTRPLGTNGFYPAVFIYSSAFAFYFNDDFRITGTTLSSNTWYHMALVRNGNTYTGYINGVSQGTYSASNSITGLSRFRIGSGSEGNAYSVNGHIDEFRVSNIARYTTTFTPAASAFANDANTLLLIHADGTDASTAFTDDTA